MAPRLTAALLALAAVLLAVGCEPRGQARAIDGDSLVVADTEIRLFGIDAPELGQSCARDGATWSCGGAAFAALREILARGPVHCRPVETDRYGRTIARCTSGGADIGAMMVRRGLAVAYTRYSERYVLEENEARMARRGIWAGSFTPPELWRRRRRKK